MFNIIVEDPEKPAAAGQEAGKLHVWQNSWGLSTRSIGVMVMVHGDDKGLVLPPRVAHTQVVVVPTGITSKTTEEQRKAVFEGVEKIVADLTAAGIRAKADTREGYTPGFKWAHWEVKVCLLHRMGETKGQTSFLTMLNICRNQGVPVRLDFGPKDVEKSQVLSARRDTGDKQALSLATLTKEVPVLLENIQADMFARAKKKYDENIVVITRWDELVPALNNAKVCVLPWCDVEACEDDIKERSAAE
jgi:prolyl-tRNA synthetase